jgi:SAM-dependent methyltransferase
MSSALAIYAAALHRAAGGTDGRLQMTRADGTKVKHLDTATWCADLRGGDTGVLARCAGPTLDIGCGPGRLTAALTTRGLPALGIDISRTAIRLARARSAPAMARSVFAPLPDEGCWQHALLIDGNLGIGGDPRRLLRRCTELIGAAGTVLVEVEPPGTATWHGDVAISDHRRTSEMFAWSVVSVDHIGELAADAALAVADLWTEEERWFACLTR